MKKLLGIALICAVVFVACNKDDDDDNTMNQTDLNFMTMASYSNHNEIAAGRIADSSAVDSAVDMFGRMMVMDHTTAETELTSLAQQMGTSIPQMPDSAHIAMGQMLRSLAGTTTFDQTYISSQVTDHQATISLFQNEINNGINQSVKAYAQKYLPKIQMHKQMADSIRMGL